MKTIVLSDLHLGQNGADNLGYISLLSNVVGQYKDKALDKRNKLATAVKEFANGEELCLIVVGDFLDLSLATMKSSLDDMLYFLSGLPEVAELIYVVGNHDHIFWTTHCEQKMAQKMLTGIVPDAGSVYVPTSVLGDVSLPLQNLINIQLKRDMEVAVAYPSLTLSFGENIFRFEHGHLAGDIYTTFSTILGPYLKDFPVERYTATVNAPLIDFIYWRSGEMGDGIGVDGLLEAVYADYEKGSPSLLKEFFANSVDGLFPNGIVSGIPDSWERSILKYFVRKIAVKMAKDKMISMNSTDRYADVNTTRAKTKKWLDSIGLNNPQYKLNVVCGHTHIKDEYEYPSKIKLYNVGGWEIEQNCLEPECSVLFINDDGTTELKSI